MEEEISIQFNLPSKIQARRKLCANLGCRYILQLQIKLVLYKLITFFSKPSVELNLDVYIVTVVSLVYLADTETMVRIMKLF